jgi:hypothetical protein
MMNKIQTILRYVTCKQIRCYKHKSHTCFKNLCVTNHFVLMDIFMSVGNQQSRGKVLD